MNYRLKRYLDGSGVQVWTDLLSAGGSLRSYPKDWDDANEVVSEIMSRVRQNIDVLAERLPKLGYEFTPFEEVTSSPVLDAAKRLDDLEAHIGRMPLALRKFFEEVGAVDFSGSCPSWDHPYPDPLVIYSPFSFNHVVIDHDDLVEHGHVTSETPFRLDFAPDYLHKADISGGAPYAMEVPNGAVDGLVLGEFHQTTFINYLRIAFRWAGFPGWDRQQTAGSPPTFPAALAALASELEPI